MVRLATLGLSHEANTFAPSRVSLDSFAEGELLRGQEIVDGHTDGRSTMAGYLDLASEPQVSLVPLVFGTVTPAGAIEASAFESIVTEMVSGLRGSGPWDGILLALHGAAVAEGYPDADGQILRRVRAAAGPHVPIGVSADLHANVSQDMIRYADVLATYRTNPHVDARQRAAETGRLVVRAARGEIHPTMAVEQVPAVLGILSQNTDDDPMRSLLEARAELAAAPGVLSASVAEGYPYADVAELGMSAVVVTDGDTEEAKRAARQLGLAIWKRRAQFSRQAASVAEAVRQAGARSGEAPVLLLDVGDNIGAGAPGDSTALVAEAAAQRTARVLSIVNDPAAAARGVAAGVGARCYLRVGADRDPARGPVLEIDATVRAVHGGRYQDHGTTHAGQRFFDTGPSCLVGYDQDCLLVLTSKPVMPSSLAQLRALGVDPEAMNVIIAKGVNSPLTAYGSLTTERILVDSPGLTPADATCLPYRRRRRPLYPFEAETAYPSHDHSAGRS